MTLYGWVLLITSLALLASLLIGWQDRSLRYELAELRTRLDEHHPPTPRGRHRKNSTGATAVSALDLDFTFDSDGGD